MASGFKMHNRRVGLNLEQCLLVMRTMAKLHAASVILHIRNPQAFKKFDASFFQEPSLQEPFGNFIKGDQKRKIIFALKLCEGLLMKFAIYDHLGHRKNQACEALGDDVLCRVEYRTPYYCQNFGVTMHYCLD